MKNLIQYSKWIATLKINFKIKTNISMKSYFQLKKFLILFIYKTIFKIRK